MSDLVWLSEAQMRRIEPYFPLSHGVVQGGDKAGHWNADFVLSVAE